MRRLALLLAVEMGAQYVLTDERAGWLAATRLGIAATGVLSVLGRAKNLGLILRVPPLLDELETGLPFCLAADFKERALRAMGE